MTRTNQRQCRRLLSALLAVLIWIPAVAGAEALKIMCPADAEASFRINGVDMGTCPATVQMHPGEYEVTVDFPDGVTWTQTIRVAQGDPTIVFPSARASEPRPLPKPDSSQQRNAEAVKTPAQPLPQQAAPTELQTDQRAEDASRLEAALETNRGSSDTSAPDRVNVAGPSPEQRLDPADTRIGTNRPSADAQRQQAGADSFPTSDGEPLWYVPQENEETIAWNTHDPWSAWGTSQAVTTGLGFTSFIGALKGDVATNLVINYKFRTELGFQAGKLFLHDDLTSLGFTFFRNRGWRFHDGLLPDYSIGLLYPDLAFRYVGNFGDTNFANVNLAIGGLRVVAQDFLTIDTRLEGGAFVGQLEDSETGIAAAWSLMFEAGVTFP